MSNSDSHRQGPGSQSHEENRETTPRFTSFKPSSLITSFHKSETNSSASRLDFHTKDRRQHNTWPNNCRNSKHSLDQIRPAKAFNQCPTDPEESPTCQGFEINTVGDPQNQEFESLNRSEIAHYVRFGAGNLIGLDQSLRIDRSSSNLSKILLESDQYVEGNWSGSRTLCSPIQPDGRELQYESRSVDGDLTGLDSNFIPFEDSRPPNETGWPPIEDSGLETTQDQLLDDNPSGNLVPRNGSRFGNDQQFQNRTQRSVDRSFILRIATSAGQEETFSHRIRQDPSDLQAWLGLISCRPSAHVSNGTYAERKSMADVRLSLYAQALVHARGAHAKEQLTLGMMSEARMTWTAAKQASQWTKILDEQPESVMLKMQNLNFAQTDNDSFDYDDVRQAYLDCLKLIQDRRARCASCSSENVEFYELQIYVTLRMTLFLREAGYVEYSIAAWQALLEFEFFRPTTFTDERQYSASLSSETVASFKAFWDAEVSRIGDIDAQGWSHLDAAQVPSAPLQPKPAGSAGAAGSHSSIREHLAAWSAGEHAKARESHLPARIQHTLATTDPFGIVLFPEVEPFLIVAAAPTCRQLLIDAFLVFCGLPPNQNGSGGKIRSWQNDPFVFQASSTADQRTSNLFEIPLMRSFQIHQQTLWADPKDWFYAFSPDENIFATHRSLCLDWVLRVIDSLINVRAEGSDLAEYRLALETAVAPTCARKKAKALLKTYPTSLRLYNGLALLEHRLVGSDRACNIIFRALDMSRDLDQLSQQESILLWHSLMWSYLYDGMYDKALDTISCYPDLSPDKTSSVLNAIQVYSNPRDDVPSANAAKYLTSTRDQLLSNGEGQLAATAADSIVLLTYLQNNLSLVAASETFESNIIGCGAHFLDRTYKEQSYQMFSRLIYHHCTRSKQFKPVDVGLLLAKAVAEFPLNPIFLSLFSWHQARSRIDDRLQAMRDVVFNSDAMDDETGSVIIHSWAIYSEMRRSLSLGSNTNATRATFERAVESAGGKHCAALWRRYFLFEKSKGEDQRAKDVLYRSITACPWIKDLYLVAFDYLRDVPHAMPEAEITGIYYVMERKGMRLHNDLNLVNETNRGWNDDRC